MWHLIHNELKILIDPLVFADRSYETIAKQVNLVDTMQDYMTKIDPSLCKVTFFYPRFAAERLIPRRTFRENDDVVFIDEAPTEVHELIKEPTEKGLEHLRTLLRTYNQCFTAAVNNKCIFMLTVHPFHADTKHQIFEDYGLKLVTLEELQENIEYFLQGFYNFFKFRNAIYGINAPDLAHSMTDEFFQRVLIAFESRVNQRNQSNESKERIRSFVHNRYVDILVTVDEIFFFKLQQRIHAVENNALKNNNPPFHGYIRYYLNNYLFLVWGATDHLAWIINDAFNLGYDPEKRSHLPKVGLTNSLRKQEFLLKIKDADKKLYDFITSESIQEWLDFFGQLRHQSAHREMFNASPLLVQTEESQISDEEIDKILYKDSPPFEDPESLKSVMGEEMYKRMEENQRINDRYHYRLSKFKKGFEHFAVVKRNNKQFMFDPVGRIPVDLKNLRELIEHVSNSCAEKK